MQNFITSYDKKPINISQTEEGIKKNLDLSIDIVKESQNDDFFYNEQNKNIKNIIDSIFIKIAELSKNFNRKEDIFNSSRNEEKSRIEKIIRLGVDNAIAAVNDDKHFNPNFKLNSNFKFSSDKSANNKAMNYRFPIEIKDKDNNKYYIKIECNKNITELDVHQSNAASRFTKPKANGYGVYHSNKKNKNNEPSLYIGNYVNGNKDGDGLAIYNNNTYCKGKFKKNKALNDLSYVKHDLGYDLDYDLNMTLPYFGYDENLNDNNKNIDNDNKQQNYTTKEDLKYNMSQRSSEEEEKKSTDKQTQTIDTIIDKNQDIRIVQDVEYHDDYINDKFFIYTGEVKNGKPNGMGTAKYHNNEIQLYKGEFKNGEPNGMGTIKYSKKKILYKGEIKDGEPNGMGFVEYCYSDNKKNQNV